MRWNTKKTLPILLLLFLGGGAAAAQCERCRWSDRGDRFEGIKNRQVSGGCCELLGVHYQRADRLAEGAPRLYLHFWMPAPARPDIVVWQPSTNYLMIPKEKRYGEGLQSFSWPRQEVLEPLRVQTDRLYARVVNPAKVYFPVLLSTSEKPSPAGSYRFFLQSGGGIEGRCTIEREVDGRLVPVRSLPVKQEFGGVFPIDWDGRDDGGRTVPPGVYALRIKGLLDAETIEKLNFVAHFQHYGRFQ